MMTYADLLLKLQLEAELNPSVMEQTVMAVTPDGEYISLLAAFKTKEAHCDVLDDGHLVLAMSGTDLADVIHGELPENFRVGSSYAINRHY